MTARSSSTIASCPDSEMYKWCPDNANPEGPEREAESAGTPKPGTVPVLPGPVPAIVVSVSVTRSRALTASFPQSEMYSVLGPPRTTSPGYFSCPGDPSTYPSVPFPAMVVTAVDVRSMALMA